MIYNFNLGIGWASSGVEYAQAYRAKMFRNIGADAKFVFTDFISSENIEHLTKNIGFLDSEILWLYSYFTDFPIEPVTYTLQDLEATFDKEHSSVSRQGKIVRYIFAADNSFYTAYLVNESEDFVHRVEFVSKGYLVRKDFFTSGRLFSEYYAPLDNKAHLYNRRFFNQDGSLAYEEIIDQDKVMYKFKDKVLCSKEDFVGYMVSCLNLTGKDTVIIDRSTQIGQPILMNCGKAKVGIIVHADHFSEKETNEDTILWNNYYEYDFNMSKHIDFYVCATEAQSKLLKAQFKKYRNEEIQVYTIPVGSLKELKYPAKKRKPYSLITASRLAAEKHIDWIIQAVIAAKKTIPELTLDIYGVGGEQKKCQDLINQHQANDYITLKGQQDLTEVYQNYEVYIAGSTSEGFGLTLMEAVGAGCPIIGFDVRYGNPTFIHNGKNGYCMPLPEETEDRILALQHGIEKCFSQDLKSFHEVSYQVAEDFLTRKVEKRWKKVVM